MYAAPNRSTTHRLARLDVPIPSFMRAAGECTGMFALESAMDDLAIACEIDPIELRIRNEPDVDPETGHPFSSRGLVTCLREGAPRSVSLLMGTIRSSLMRPMSEPVPGPFSRRLLPMPLRFLSSPSTCTSGIPRCHKEHQVGGRWVQHRGERPSLKPLARFVSVS